MLTKHTFKIGKPQFGIDKCLLEFFTQITKLIGEVILHQCIEQLTKLLKIVIANGKILLGKTQHLFKCEPNGVEVP